MRSLQTPMLLLRAFPLSISIFWRFLLVLPFWAIFYAVITVVSVGGAIILASSGSIFGLLLLLVWSILTLAVTLVVSTHPYLVGIGIGLRTLGVAPKTTLKRMLQGAAGFGIFEAFVAFMVSAILMIGYILIIQREFGELGNMHIERVTDPVATLSRQLTIGALVTISVFSSLVVMAMRAALLPAMANYVAGRNPAGRLGASVDGFGEKFVTMMLLMLMITGISTAVIPFVGDAARYTGLADMLDQGLSDLVLFAVVEQKIEVTFADAATAFFGVLLSVWLFCLQCAGAALSYESRMQEVKEHKKLNTKSSEEVGQSMAELRRSRMPNRME